MKTCFCSITRITYCNFSSLDYSLQNSLFFLSNWSHWIEISPGLLNINSIEGKTKCVLEVVDKMANCFTEFKWIPGRAWLGDQTKQEHLLWSPEAFLKVRIWKEKCNCMKTSSALTGCVVLNGFTWSVYNYSWKLHRENISPVRKRWI